jgi:hypothetical protein
MEETYQQIKNRSRSSLLDSWQKHKNPQQPVEAKAIPTPTPEVDIEAVETETVIEAKPQAKFDNGILEAIKHANEGRQIKLTKIMYERLYGPHRDHWKRYYMMDQYYKKPGTIKADDIYCFNMEAPGEPILKKNKVSELPSKNLMEEKLKELENIFN